MLVNELVKEVIRDEFQVEAQKIKDKKAINNT